MNAPEDKRRQRRVAAELWIEVEADGELYFQRASNLSVGGAYFTQTFPLPVGTRVALRFCLPGEQAQIDCRAEIVNAEDLGMGVRFLDLRPADAERLEALIDRQTAPPAVG
jgi:uncharacterized protein (TIGR02266 family)